MSYIHFSKDKLHNLSFSLEKEILQVNSVGAYCSSSLINCNTRKYHGLLVVPQPQIDESRYVFLSTLDETIVKKDEKYQLGTHCYPNTYFPKGYNFIENFTYEKVPKWIIRADDILLKKEILLVEDEETVLIRYTIIDSTAPFQIRFSPFTSFRNTHELSESSLKSNKKYEIVTNGIKFKMYPEFSNLYLQFSHKVEFTPSPDWHYNNEYPKEKERGYQYSEDLFCPGYFTTSLNKGDQIIFSASLSKVSPRNLIALFEEELQKRILLKNFNDCLLNAAKQFIIKTKNGIEVNAGYPWFGRWGRDTFISLPGLTLSIGQPQLCKKVIDTMLKDLKNGLFPNIGKGSNAVYNSADSSLWFFWALQQYAVSTNTVSEIWKEYGSKMKSILDNYSKGTLHFIHMKENGLLFAGEKGFAITWMDAVVDGVPVTPRIGMTVELNALWYNAICFSLESAEHAKDEYFISKWEPIARKIEVSFITTFWDKERGYLADCVNEKTMDWSFRPNQIFALSLPYSPVNEFLRREILEKIKDKLLTPRGLRTLSRDDKNYKGIYKGNQKERDLAYHQGTVWPWLLGHFIEACLKTYKEKAFSFVQLQYNNFESTITEYGLGTIAEIYDGDKPHRAKGAISQAWSVAELLRIRNMIFNENIADSKKIRIAKTLQKG